MKDNQQFWNRFAKIYGPFMKRSYKLYENISQFMSSYLSLEDEVLEVACGSGQLSFLNAMKVKRWYASDFSQKMINEANMKNHLTNLSFDYQDAISLTYDDQSFDVVVIANALHIMPHPQKALLEIKRVLKNEGVIIAPTFIHGESFRYHLRLRLMKMVGFQTYYQWNEKSFVEFIESQGFEVKEHCLLGNEFIPLCFLVARKRIEE